jgi:hypothetical protein
MTALRPPINPGEIGLIDAKAILSMSGRKVAELRWQVRNENKLLASAFAHGTCTDSRACVQVDLRGHLFHPHADATCEVEYRQITNPLDAAGRVLDGTMEFVE